MLCSNLPKGKDGVQITDNSPSFTPLEAVQDHVVFTCTNTSTMPLKSCWPTAEERDPSALSKIL